MPDTGREMPRFAATPEQIAASITDEHLISFIDGSRWRMLKKHLHAVGMTLSEYLERFGLPADYPIAAPGWATRSFRHRPDLLARLGTTRWRQADEPDQSAPERFRGMGTPA